MSLIYFIGGVPCCGKTSFGDWLRDNRGFLHLDLESPQFNQSCVHPIWNRLLLGRNLQLFASELSKLHPRVVITWGVPLSCAWTVEMIGAGGATTWWFDGDLEKAKKCWETREGRTIDGFALQHFKDLRNRKPEFVKPFGQRILCTLDQKGHTHSLDQIAEVLGIPDYP